MKRFLVGSKYFFSCYPDFVPGDTDIVELVDTTAFTWSRVVQGQGNCIFQFNINRTKEELIDWTMRSSCGLVVGKFLVPEFCAEIGFTIEDLQKLNKLFNCLDEKHQYEIIIRDAYLSNNAFSLTKEQRELAYKSYKESRGMNNE